MLERGRLLPSMVFLLFWTTFVYYFLAHWEWNPAGWLAKLGVLDFAGSGPVHIASGFGALAWSLMLGRRKDPYQESHHPKLPHFKPHNPVLVAIGTILIWFGWLAFNGGSTANLSIRSVYAVVNTNLSACGGGVSWVILEYIHTKRFSIVGFSSGIISGLVGITPAAGFVPVYTSTLIGWLTAAGCFYVTKYKYLIGVDEGLDIFAIHGVGGVIGDIMTGFFAAPFVPALDGVTSTNEGGWYAQNWKQMGYQLVGAVTCASWSFFISCFLLFVIDKVPGLHIRATEEAELQGLDQKYFFDCEDDIFGTGRSIHGSLAGQLPIETAAMTPPPEVEQKKD